jgi:thiamine pyrophosphokinase
VVFGGFGGRLDQEMQNMNVLYTHSHWFKQLTMLSTDCYACLLPSGVNYIVTLPPTEGKECGLIPLGRPVASLTTSGLHWDVTDWRSEFGGNISSSNRVQWFDATAPDPTNVKASKGRLTTPVLVAVNTSDPIIWTSSLADT